MDLRTIVHIVLVTIQNIKQSSWWGRESWFHYFVCLPGVLRRLLCSGSSSRCHLLVCNVCCGISSSYSFTFFIQPINIHQHQQPPTFRIIDWEKYLMATVWSRFWRCKMRWLLVVDFSSQGTWRAYYGTLNYENSKTRVAVGRFVQFCK